MRRLNRGVLVLLVLAGTLAFPARSWAQGNTADLNGVVTDPSGSVMKDAKVTVTNVSTEASRNATTDSGGRYSFVQLPPGRYKLTVDAGASFSLFETPELQLTVGATAAYDAQMRLHGQTEAVEVTGTTALVETQKTEVSQTVDARRIDNLPINGRNYINFTLTNSQTSRDAAPSIGAAPTSGLNFGGQRARSNEVSVDGADAVDNSTNGIRTTVSQEAVQEFQLILSNYNAEYGRAMGGVVNIVTKSGANDVHGNVFGYFRHKKLQARNPFSGQINPVTGALDPVKQAYTRLQAGATLGGPIKKDKAFYFISYEHTQREETGFSSIGVGNFGLQSFTLPTPGGPFPVQLTPAQGAAVNQLLATGVPALQNLAVQYGVLMGSASNVALNGIDYGAVATGFGFPNPGPGARFPLPVPCPAGLLVNGLQCGPTGFGLAPLPASFVPLNSLRGNYPITEKTSLWSARLDYRWNNTNNSFLRVGVSPSLVTGIQVNAQNQNFGQNAGSRTSLNQSRDFSAVYQLDSVLSNAAVNQLRFQYARRGLHYGYSQLPGGSGLAVNIPGFAFFGREPFSTVDRIERRLEWTDHVGVIHGNHTFKMGGDFNIVSLRTGKAQIFELNFGGISNFGGLSASQVSGGAFPNSVTVGLTTIALPGTTGAQSYGLGLPTTFIQGIGNSNRTFDNIPIAFFFQDSWRMNRKLTLNYGLRYDVEITPLLPAATTINQQAEQILKVVEGIPRDYNNVSPRFGLAWDPRGNGKTVIRAGYGIFFDHPLLAVAFNAFTAEGALSSQLLSAGGTPSGCFLAPGIPGGCGAGDSPTNLNAASIFQGVLNALPSMDYRPDEQRFNPKFPNSLFTNQNFLPSGGSPGFPIPILPFTLPVAANFRYGYAQQANLTIERQLAGSWRLSAGYQYTHGLKLNRPRDTNSTDPQLLDNNLFNAGVAGLSFSSPLTVVAPSASFAAAGSNCGVNVIAPRVLGVLTGCPGPLAPLNGSYIGTPAFFNYFRPSGPNPSFAGLVPGGYGPATVPGSQLFFAAMANYPLGYGIPIPYNSVDVQESSGNSVYHGLTVNVSKRFSHSFEMLSSYTWSHAIDDSTDLQTLLEPQDGRFPNNERGNSSFDQRHRWVTSAVFQASSAKSGEGAWKHFIGGFTLAPIIEVASGRPFTVITGTDYRLDLGAAQGRPSVGTGAVTATSPFIPGVTFTLPNVCLTNSGATFSIPPITTTGAGCTGNLGRNAFYRPGFFQWDLRLARRFALGERFKLDAIADAFNLFNHFNVADVSPLCNPAGGNAGCTAGQPSAALDQRQIQVALKVSW